VPKYLAVHGKSLLLPLRNSKLILKKIQSEVLSLAVAELPAFVAASNPESTAKIEERRTWNLYRAYPSVAQGNVQSSSA
jgi:hypothetical protein